MSRQIPIPTDLFDDRGVSDIVAFTLTFSVIVSSVAVVSLIGVGSLENVRDNARAESAEVSMVGMHETFETVRTQEVPSRTRQLQLQGDSLYRLGSGMRIEVDGTPRSPDPDVEFDTGAFIRETGETRFVYEGGAVYREERRGEVVVRDPPLRCGSDTAHVNVVTVQGDTNTTAGGSDVAESGDPLDQEVEPATGTVVVNATESISESVYPNPTAGENGSATTVTIDVGDSYNQDAWEQVFEDLDGWSSAGGNQYECADVNRVYVHHTEIALEIRG